MTPARAVGSETLYGPRQSRFARYLERREERRPDPVARELRGRVLAGLRGQVLELGCGDGRAFELYRPGVERVLAVEPDPHAREVAAGRARDAAIPIEVVDGDARALPAEDGTFDAAVLVWVLCSVPDPTAVLRGLRRVLKPGGELRFYDHVRSPHALFRSLQRAADWLFLDAGAGRLRNDAGHGRRDRSRRVRARRARARLPLVIAPHDHLGAVRPGHGAIAALNAVAGIHFFPATRYKRPPPPPWEEL
jgi:SAM-dependent methyltransferase